MLQRGDLFSLVELLPVLGPEEIPFLQCLDGGEAAAAGGAVVVEHAVLSGDLACQALVASAARHAPPEELQEVVFLHFFYFIVCNGGQMLQKFCRKTLAFPHFLVQKHRILCFFVKFYYTMLQRYMNYFTKIFGLFRKLVYFCTVILEKVAQQSQASQSKKQC